MILRNSNCNLPPAWQVLLQSSMLLSHLPFCQFYQTFLVLIHGFFIYWMLFYIAPLASSNTYKYLLLFRKQLSLQQKITGFPHLAPDMTCLKTEKNISLCWFIKMWTSDQAGQNLCQCRAFCGSHDQVASCLLQGIYRDRFCL